MRTPLAALLILAGCAEPAGDLAPTGGTVVRAWNCQARPGEYPGPFFQSALFQLARLDADTQVAAGPDGLWSVRRAGDRLSAEAFVSPGRELSALAAFEGAVAVATGQGAQLRVWSSGAWKSCPLPKGEKVSSLALSNAHLLVATTGGDQWGRLYRFNRECSDAPLIAAVKAGTGFELKFHRATLEWTVLENPQSETAELFVGADVLALTRVASGWIRQPVVLDAKRLALIRGIGSGTSALELIDRSTGAATFTRASPPQRPWAGLCGGPAGLIARRESLPGNEPFARVTFDESFVPSVSEHRAERLWEGGAVDLSREGGRSLAFDAGAAHVHG